MEPVSQSVCTCHFLLGTRRWPPPGPGGRREEAGGNVRGGGGQDMCSVVWRCLNNDLNIIEKSICLQFERFILSFNTTTRVNWLGTWNDHFSWNILNEIKSPGWCWSQLLHKSVWWRSEDHTTTLHHTTVSNRSEWRPSLPPSLPPCLPLST